MRYSFVNTKKRHDGIPVYKSVYYPVIYPSYNDIYHISNNADYLDSIAFKYYGNSEYWWIIARANNISTGRLSIPEGTQLRIPQNIAKIIQEFKNANQ